MAFLWQVTRTFWKTSWRKRFYYFGFFLSPESLLVVQKEWKRNWSRQILWCPLRQDIFHAPLKTPWTGQRGQCRNRTGCGSLLEALLFQLDPDTGLASAQSVKRRLSRLLGHERRGWDIEPIECCRHSVVSFLLQTESYILLFHLPDLGST